MIRALTAAIIAILTSGTAEARNLAHHYSYMPSYNYYYYDSPYNYTFYADPAYHFAYYYSPYYHGGYVSSNTGWVSPGATSSSYLSVGVGMGAGF